MYIMVKIKSRKNNLKRKLSKKNNKLFGSSPKMVGGGGLETEITIIINPNEKDDVSVIEGAFAFMKFETNFDDEYQSKIMAGGAQVCTTQRSQMYCPINTIRRIIADKLTTPQDLINCINYIQSTGILDNVNSDDLGLPRPNRVINRIAVNVRTINSGFVFNFFEMAGYSLFLPRIDPMHATVHPISALPNDGMGSIHAYGTNNRGSKIVWYMCAQSDCDDDNIARVPGPPPTYTFQRQVNANPLIPNIASRINPTYFISTETANGFIGGQNLPIAEIFYRNFIEELRTFILNDINININQYLNLDQHVKQLLSEILENVCHDVNYDRQYTVAQLQAGVPNNHRNRQIGINNYCHRVGTYPNNNVRNQLHNFDIWAVDNPRSYAPPHNQNPIINLPIQNNPFTTDF